MKVDKFELQKVSKIYMWIIYTLILYKKLRRGLF